MRILILFLMATVWSVPGLAADPLKPREGDLKVGDAAPAFELKQLGAENQVKLADLKSKPVLLVFGSCT